MNKLQPNELILTGTWLVEEDVLAGMRLATGSRG